MPYFSAIQVHKLYVKLTISIGLGGNLGPLSNTFKASGGNIGGGNDGGGKDGDGNEFIILDCEMLGFLK